MMTPVRDVRVGATGLLLVALLALPRAPASECIAEGGRTAANDTSKTLTLDLNIPAFRLVARENDIVVREIPVAVGRAAYPTPVGNYGVDYVVWNPPWTPPPSPWARNEKPQRPGPDNWMGRVKLHFTGFVFLHGSPFTQSFGSAASHACVRMANADAIALARLVHRHASPALDTLLLDSLVRDDQRTRWITLQAIIPLTVRYSLAEIRGDTLEIYPNVYPRQGASTRAHVLAALADRDMTIDSVRLNTVVRQSRRSKVMVPLSSLP